MIISMRAAASSSNYNVDPTDERYWTGSTYFGRESSSGEHVNPQTSMGLAAVFACIDAISSDSSVFPINIFRRTGPTTSELANEEKEREHYILNHSPNDNATAISMRRHLLAQCLGWGNGLAEFQRLGDRSIYQIHSLQSAAMQPKLDDSGRLYWLLREDGEERRIDDEDLLHVMGPSDNGLVGWPLSYYASDAFGEGLAKQKYASAFFRNSGVPSGILTHPGRMKPEAERRVLEAWTARHSGGASSSHKTALLMEGMEFKQTTINPRDAEMIDERRFSVEEVARWYRIKPSKIQHFFQAKGWNSVESDNKAYLLESLMPWLERIEAEIDRKMLGGGVEYFSRHDYSRLLQPDAVARADKHTKEFSVGAVTINEIRLEEGRNPIGPDGDVHFVPVNLQPLEKALDPPEPPPQPALPPPQDPDDSEPGDDDDDDADDDTQDDAQAFATRAIERLAMRFLRKERKAMARIYGKAKGSREAFETESAKFAAKLASEIHEEFSALLDLSDARSLLALCSGYGGEACEQYASAFDGADVEAIAQARNSTEPKRWAREIIALAALSHREVA